MSLGENQYNISIKQKVLEVARLNTFYLIDSMVLEEVRILDELSYSMLVK